MKKTKFLKNATIMLVCAVMLVFAGIVAVNDTAEANVSILAMQNEYQIGEGPAEDTVTGMPEGEEYTKWDLGTHKLPEGPTSSDPNFKFMYWNVTNDKGETARYDAGASYEVGMEDTGTLTITAVWGVPLTYDANLSDDSENVKAPESKVIAYKTSVELEKMTATNYDFMGWAKTSDAVVADYKVGEPLPAADVTGAVKLYAVWKANFFQVIYHANTNSDEGDAAVTVPVDTTKYMGDNLTATIMGNGKLASSNKNYATMKDATPTREGYTFAGWATTATATTVEYKPEATVQTMDKDLELYAVWTKGAATETSTTKTTSTTPQTGDSDHFALYVVMAALSLFGICYLGYDQKKAKARK